MESPTSGRDGPGGDPMHAERIVSSSLVSRIARWGLISWSLIGLGLVVFMSYRYVLWPVRVIFPPLLVALAVVYLLNPVVSRLQRRGIPRGWGTLLAYLVFFGILGTLLWFLIPVFADQVSSFVSSVPDLLARAQEWATNVLRRIDVNADTSQLFGSLTPSGSAGEFISRIFGFTVGILHVVLILVLGAVFGFYLLVDLPKMKRVLSALIPATRRPEVTQVGQEMSVAVGGFFRGQLLVALFVGLASMLGLWIVGLPYWAIVGAVAGLFNLIPLIGPFIGAIPAIFIAFTTQSSEGLLHLQPGWPLAVGSALALLIVQQIDNHIISPNVVSRTVKLHPLTVMLGLLVGGTLLGLWGMILAVPVIAAMKILALHVWDTRMHWPPGPPADGPGPEGNGAQDGDAAPRTSTDVDAPGHAAETPSPDPAPVRVPGGDARP
jgi:predicted PurR-regulated permease PerM